MERKCNTCLNWKFLAWIKTIRSDHNFRGESHINCRTQCVIMTLTGAIANDVLKSRKIIEFPN